MNKYTYCKRIFDTDFAYNYAIRQTGEHKELKSMLDAIGSEHLIMYTDEFEKVYPIKTLYHNYKENILVLTNTGEGFMGQTFKFGKVDIGFDMQAEKAKAKSFFEQAGQELTVIDFFTGKEIKPDYKTVEAYIEQVTKTEKQIDQHRSIMLEFKQRHKVLRSECEALYATSPSTSYKKALHLLSECMETAEAAFCIEYRSACREIESYLSFAPEFEGYVKLFGLYVFVLKYGIEHKRFLKRGTRTMSLNFNNTISEMRKFVSENEGIVDKYIDYMQLTRNERENLIFLLSEEQLMTYGKAIGDELFC